MSDTSYIVSYDDATLALKRAAGDLSSGPFGSGGFGSVNLKAPRSPRQSGFIWKEKATYVELLYEFVTCGAPAGSLVDRKLQHILGALDRLGRGEGSVAVKRARARRGGQA